MRKRLLEKGWLLATRLKNYDEALRCFGAAHAEDPSWLMPSVTLEWVAAAAKDGRNVARAYAWSLVSAKSPAYRLSRVRDLAALSLREACEDPEEVLNALREPTSDSRARMISLFQMEAFAAANGMASERISALRQLAAGWQAEKKSDPLRAASCLRRAAQLARSLGGDHLQMAYATMEEARALAGNHPLLVDATAQWIEQMQGRRDELPPMRRPTAGERDCIPDYSLFRRERDAMEKGDWFWLGQLFLEEAESEVPLVALNEQQWRADAYWRSALAISLSSKRATGGGRARRGRRRPRSQVRR